MTVYAHNANDLTDVMNSDTPPSSVVSSASSIYSAGYEAFRAFNHVGAGNGWASGPGSSGWLKIYSGGVSWNVTSYTITAMNDSASAAPKNWTLQGSNNGSDWTTLDTQTDQAGWGSNDMRTYTVSSPGSYKYYKLNITANCGNPDAVEVGELELIGTIPADAISGDVSESSESTDTIDGYVNVFGDVTESSESTDQVNGTKNAENIDVSESSESTDQVDVFQDISICDVTESSESTDSNTVSAGADANVSESSESTDVVECLDTIVVPSITETSESTDIVDCSKWSGATLEIFDSLSIRDTVANSLWLTVQDTLGFSDTAVIQIGIVINDILSLVDTHIINWHSTQTLTDSIECTEEVLKHLHLTLTDTLGLTDESHSVLVLVINELMSLLDVVQTRWNSTHTLSDNILIKDTLEPAILYLTIADSIGMSDTVLNTLIISVLEQLQFTDFANAIGRYNHTIDDSAQMQDTVGFGFTELISDMLVAADTVSLIGLIVNSITDGFAISDVVSNIAHMDIPVFDTVAFTDTISSRGMLYNTIQDGFLLNLSVNIANEIYECWVLNTPKFLPSIYSGWDFNSYCIDQESKRAYGCKNDGIYELTGDTDNGVAFHTGVELSQTTFSIANQKRFRKAYVGVTGTTPMMVMELEDGTREAYTIDEDGEVDVSRAQKSRSWKLKVVDFDTLSFIKLIPVVLAK